MVVPLDDESGEVDGDASVADAAVRKQSYCMRGGEILGRMLHVSERDEERGESAENMVIVMSVRNEERGVQHRVVDGGESVGTSLHSEETILGLLVALTSRPIHAFP